MDVDAIRGLQPEMARFLGRFEDCLPAECFAHLRTYVEGQLSELERKNVERIALYGGVTPRTLQEFLANYEWDHEAMRERLQRIVAMEHAGSHTIGIIDETSFAKKGDKTPGVQRQYCGSVGKQENCVVTVHLSFACDDFHCLLDEELFLPKSWSDDRERCREAGIPDEVVYRPKSAIALEEYDRAVSNGVQFDWLTFDAWYGAKPAFLSALIRRNQKFVAEVHKDHRIWMEKPRVTNRPYRKNGRGNGRKTPRLVSGSAKAKTVGECLESCPVFTKQSWQMWRVKDTQKGPKVVEVKHAIVYPKNENGLPSQAHHLLVVRDVQAPENVKFFLCYAPVNTSVKILLKVAFSRWRVERCFEDDKKYVGMDHFEGRRYLGLLRHLIISAVSLLFLARVRQKLLDSYPELTVSQVYQATSAVVQSWWLTPTDAERLISSTAYRIAYYQRRNAQARESHTRTRIANLESVGIDVATMNQCDWDSS
jgi:SRSO17 transposase